MGVGSGIYVYDMSS